MHTATDSYVGRHTSGVGNARLVSQEDWRREQLRRLFGCEMIGTFNVDLEQPPDMPEPTIELTEPTTPNPGNRLHRYWLVRLQQGDLVRYGWHFRCSGSTQKPERLEIHTRSALPDVFRSGALKVDLLERYRPEWIEEMAAAMDHRWWAPWSWLPAEAIARTERPLADCDEAWRRIHERCEGGLAGATVLDWGCHTGYYAQQAAAAGAIALGVDQSKRTITLAQQINDHREMRDVLFRRSSELPVGRWDYVLSLSVWHQIDPDYEELADHIQALQERAARSVFLELINPPLEGSRNSVDVDAIVHGAGGRSLWYRRHPVRRHRSLYMLPGRAD